MPFSPLQYEGVGLPVLLHELVQRGASEVVAGLDKFAREPPARVYGAMAPPTIEYRTTWLTAPDPYATLPGPTHPPVVAADVELGEYLGGGNQGAVYSGRVRTTGLVVAVKIIHGEYAAGEGQAIREARIGAKLKHPNILRIFEAQKAGAFWVVIMEFLQGEDMTRSPLSENRARACFGQLADAVQAMGAARIVHRDLKPANIIKRFADQAPVLVDFGLAFDLDEPDETSDRICGTPVFMAPEAFSGSMPAHSWDAYSLGLTAASLLLENRYPHGSSLSTLIEMKVSGSFDAEVLQLLGAIRDEAIQAWCKGLMSSDPAQRLTALGQAARWLEQ